MRKIGRVVACSNGICTVEFAIDACKDCGQCTHAHVAPTIELKGSYNVGNQVLVELPDNQFLKAAFVAYLFPLLALILGLALGAYFFKSDETYILLSGVALFLCTLGILWVFERKRKSVAPWEPKIVGEIKPINFCDTQCITQHYNTQGEKTNGKC